jgi:hypothetical protein
MQMHFVCVSTGKRKRIQAEFKSVSQTHANTGNNTHVTNEMTARDLTAQNLLHSGDTDHECHQLH